MKKHFLLTLLVWGVILFQGNLVSSEQSSSETDSIPSYRMSEIIVLGERSLLPQSATIHTITRKQIEVLDVRDAHQALNYLPGLCFSRSSKNETTFQLRGFEQRQVSVFLDGVPISIPFDGVVDIAQVAGDNIESIRVSEGVSSVLYGANSLGGTVNIITGIPRSGSRLNVRMEGSDHGSFYGSASYARNLGRLKFISAFCVDKAPDFRLSNSAGAMPNEDGDRRDNSAYRKSSASFKLYFPLNASHRLGLHFNMIDNWFNVPPNALTSRPRFWQFPEWKKYVFSLNGEHYFTPGFLLRSVLFYDKYRNVLESYDDNTYTTQTFRYAFTSIYDDYSIGGILYPQLHYLPFGTTNGILSLKQDVHRQKSDEGAPFEEYTMETWTAGIEQIVQLTPSWNALIGFDGNYLRPVKAENLPLRDPIFLFNGQLSIQHEFKPSFLVHASFGRKSRFPTLKELYSERLGRSIANPDLKPEFSWNTELGLKWQRTSGYFRAALFYNRLRDLIASRQLGSNIQQMQNIGKALLRGIELDYRLNGKRMDLMLNYTFLDARNQSVNRESDYLEYRPRHRLNGVLEYRFLSRFQTGVEYSYTAGQYFQNPDNGDWEKLNNFGLLNIKISYRINRVLAVYARANNLFDRFYFSEYGVPMPGRELIAGVKFTQ